MTHWTYLLVLASCLTAAGPLQRVFGLSVLNRPRRLVVRLLPGFLISTGWDLYAIHAHQWSYDPRRLIGITLPGHLPLEEALFFIVVPVCVVLTFEAVRRAREGSR
jgi:lycopene cyclase domain-containing protein